MSLGGATPGRKPKPSAAGGAGAGPETPQHIRALAAGDVLRSRKADIRAVLSEGLGQAHCFVKEPAVANMYVRALLAMQKGWGNLKVARVMAAMGAYNPMCSQLTEEQIAIMSYYCSWPKGKGSPPPHPRSRVLPENQ